MLSRSPYRLRNCSRWAIRVSQTLARPRATGKWTGLQNGLANLSGIVAPALTGFLVDRIGKFLLLLAIAAAVLLAGGFAWVLVVGPVEQVSWGSESGEAPVATASS